MGVTLKPKLYLDVDGVLNACPPIPAEPVIMSPAGYLICIPPGTKERIARLVEVFEPVWCTAWREEAHAFFGEVLELGETWDHIDFRTYKLLGIFDDLARGAPQPWVWIDDDANWELEELGLHLDHLDSRAINPQTSIGLTDDHVEEALAFATRFREGP